MTAFTFPAPDVRLSLNGREHYMKRARITREWRQAAYVWTLHAVSRTGLKRPQPPSRIRIVFGVTDPWRRRDPHNMAPTVKAIVDGMVDAKLWPDDTSQYVTVDDPGFCAGTGVVVELTERTP